MLSGVCLQKGMVLRVFRAVENSEEYRAHRSSSGLYLGLLEESNLNIQLVSCLSIPENMATDINARPRTQPLSFNCRWCFTLGCIGIELPNTTQSPRPFLQPRLSDTYPCFITTWDTKLRRILKSKERCIVGRRGFMRCNMESKHSRMIS